MTSTVFANHPRRGAGWPRRLEVRFRGQCAYADPRNRGISDLVDK